MPFEVSMDREERTTLEINAAPTLVRLIVERDGPEFLGKSGGLLWATYPAVTVVVDTWNCLVLTVSGLYDAASVLRTNQEEVLMFAAPRIAEMKLGAMLSSGVPEAIEERLHYVEWERGGDITAVKQEAAGETYEQRSRMCFEDVCRRALQIWESPHCEAKKFTLRKVREWPEKRRVYEDKEWQQAALLGLAEGYWSEKTGRGMSLVCGIDGSKMRQLKEMLSKRSMGILPEVVGAIEVGESLDFLNGGYRDSVERDCSEINAAARMGAAKAVIVLCGSVAEALLYDLLKPDEKEAQKKAVELAKLPENALLKGELEKAAKLEIGRWGACPIIKVAHALHPDVVGADAAAYADVLRDYRNLIHPGKAERSARTVDQHTAAIAISVVNLVIKGRR
jgi:hypothetical protein